MRRMNVDTESNSNFAKSYLYDSSYLACRREYHKRRSRGIQRTVHPERESLP